jgi:CRISPR/Cas system endoribonuclease Cas6 (RAMP superfamily)
LNKIDSWFEMKDNKRYYRANMVMGFLGAIHCDLTTISY